MARRVSHSEQPSRDVRSHCRTHASRAEFHDSALHVRDYDARQCERCTLLQTQCRSARGRINSSPHTRQSRARRSGSGVGGGSLSLARCLSARYSASAPAFDCWATIETYSRNISGLVRVCHPIFRGGGKTRKARRAIVIRPRMSAYRAREQGHRLDPGRLPRVGNGQPIATLDESCESSATRGQIATAQW